MSFHRSFFSLAKQFMDVRVLTNNAFNEKKCTINKQERHCDHSRRHTGPFIFSSVSHFHSHHQGSSPCSWNVLSSNLLKFHAFLLIICTSGCFAIMDHRKDPCLNSPMVHYWLLYYHRCILISASIFELLRFLFLTIIMVFFVSSVVFWRWTSEAVQSRTPQKPINQS